jgi:hypothetical protein
MPALDSGPGLLSDGVTFFRRNEGLRRPLADEYAPA